MASNFWVPGVGAAIAGTQALGFAATLELDELLDLELLELLELEETDEELLLFELLVFELEELELLELVLELLEDETDELDFELLELDELELDELELDELELDLDELTEELVFELELTWLDELETGLDDATELVTPSPPLLLTTELELAIDEVVAELATDDSTEDELAGGVSPSWVDTEDATLTAELWVAAELATVGGAEDAVKGLGEGELVASPPPAPPPQALKSTPDKAKAPSLKLLCDKKLKPLRDKKSLQGCIGYLSSLAVTHSRVQRHNFLFVSL